MPLNPDKLRELRKERDLIQMDVAKILGITDRQYKSYESGVVDPPISRLETLADFYNISTDYLLGRSDKRKP